GVGIDALPVSIRSSKYLTGNHLGQLANVTAIPEIDASFQHPQLQHIVQYFSLSPDDMEVELYKLAGQLLNNGQVEEAWQVLLRTDL
ncbi:MAG: flavin reductase family protein, partial [Chitinophagaceae bacterium]